METQKRKLTAVPDNPVLRKLMESSSHNIPVCAMYGRSGKKMNMNVTA